MAGLSETMTVRSQMKTIFKTPRKYKTINLKFLMPQNYPSKTKTNYRFLWTNEHREFITS